MNPQDKFKVVCFYLFIVDLFCLGGGVLDLLLLDCWCSNCLLTRS